MLFAGSSKKVAVPSGFARAVQALNADLTNLDRIYNSCSQHLAKGDRSHFDEACLGYALFYVAKTCKELELDCNSAHDVHGTKF